MPIPQSYFHNFRPLECGTLIAQKEAIRWLMNAATRAHESSIDSALGRALDLYERFLSSELVRSRAFILPDCHHENWDRMVLLKDTVKPWYCPPLEERMGLFSDYTEKLAGSAFSTDTEAPSYLIQTSCTGYDSPHAIQKLACAKNWQNQTKLLHVGHMGCFASLPVTAMASKLLLERSPSSSVPRRVSTLFVELCSLHFLPRRIDIEQVVMNTLFADGAIRVDVSLDYSPGALAFIDESECILPGTENAMTWRPGDSAFLMSLSRAVPRLIQQELKKFLIPFLRRSRLEMEDISRFAVHPGGPKIIESVAEGLELSSSALWHSVQMLQRRGNMSSCSLPHIWHSMAEDPQVKDGEWIVSLAFGPGLTLAANLMRKGR